jgi:hypothetical protein
MDDSRQEDLVQYLGAGWPSMYPYNDVLGNPAMPTRL